MQKYVILMTGLPGTGKTTTSKRLYKVLPNTILIAQNDIRREHGIKKMPKKQEKVLAEIDRKIMYGLNTGQNIIFESGNRYSWRRHQIYGIASACEAGVITLETICPEELSKKRMSRRDTKDNLVSDPIDPKVYDRIKSLWEDVYMDFKDPSQGHFSYITFDTEKQKIERKIIGNYEGTKKFISKIEKILL